ASAERIESSGKSSVPTGDGIARFIRSEESAVNESAPESAAAASSTRLIKYFWNGKLSRYAISRAAATQSHGVAPSIWLCHRSTSSREERAASPRIYTA